MPPLTYPAQQVRRFDNDRFICSLFAPPGVRDGLHALYAFNIEVARTREAVNEALLGRMRLQWWRDALDAIAAGRVPDHPIAGPLAETVTRFDLSRQSFERLLDARAFDLEDGAPADMAALIAYADGTSATLASLSLEVLGVRGRDTVSAQKWAAQREAAQVASRDVAIAWALVGLLRAVPFHARARRSYLPASLCRAAGLDVLTLFERGPTAGLSTVVEDVAAVARQHLDAARQRRRDIPKGALPVLLPATMTELYLGRLARVGYDPFHPRVQHAGAGRLMVTAFRALRDRY